MLKCFLRASEMRETSTIAMLKILSACFYERSGPQPPGSTGAFIFFPTDGWWHSLWWPANVIPIYLAKPVFYNLPTTPKRVFLAPRDFPNSFLHQLYMYADERFFQAHDLGKLQVTSQWRHSWLTDIGQKERYVGNHSVGTYFNGTFSFSSKDEESIHQIAFSHLKCYRLWNIGNWWFLNTSPYRESAGRWMCGKNWSWYHQNWRIFATFSNISGICSWSMILNDLVHQRLER